MKNFSTSRSSITLPYCHLYSRELTLAKMEQVYLFDHKCMLKGTKFHENCQNNDLYQQTVILRIGTTAFHFPKQ